MQGPCDIKTCDFVHIVPYADAIKLQLVEAGLVECLLEIVQQKVNSNKEDDVAELKTASDLMVLLLLGGESLLPTRAHGQQIFYSYCAFREQNTRP